MSVDDFSNFAEQHTARNKEIRGNGLYGGYERSMVSMADMRISRERSMVSMRPGRPEGGQKQEMPVKREKEAWSV